MSKLTVLEIRNRTEPCRLADGGGLSFEITKSGVKRWLYRFRLDGKQQMHVIGRYPDVSLSDARKKHMEAQNLVKEGLNPTLKRRKAKQANRDKEQEERNKRAITFEYVALVDRTAKRWLESCSCGCCSWYFEK